MHSTAALVKLRDGKTYAATEHHFSHGWLHIVGARYWKVGPEGQERTRFGTPQAFSWPREAVREVKAAVPLPDAPKALGAPAVAA